MKPFLEQFQINFNLEYQSKIVKAKLPAYRTIYHLKELCKEAFFILRQQIHLTYKNKDITQLDHCILGDYFKGKNNIFIKVSIDYGYPIKGQSRFSEKPLYLCVCKNDIIYNYCRVCKSFICNMCRVNSVHANHKVIQVDVNNFEESAKLYAITLQSDMLYNLKIIKEISREGMKYDDLLSRHEFIKRKYDKVGEIYREMIEKMYKIPEVRGDQIESVITEYQSNYKVSNQQLENILNIIYSKYSKPHRKMTFEEMKQFYEEIHQLEEQIDSFSLSMMAYRVNYEMNMRMNKMYDQIEEILDGMLNAECPLGLDPNTYYMYQMVTGDKPKKIKKIVIKKEAPPMKFKERIVLVAKDKEGENEIRKDNSTKDFAGLCKRDNMPFDQEVNLSQDDLDMPEEEKINIKAIPTMRQKSIRNDEDGILELNNK